MDRFVGLQNDWLQMDGGRHNGYQEKKTPLGNEFGIEHFWLSVK